MTITPVEIRHVKLRRGLGGYSRRATDQLLDQVVRSYEETWRQRGELADEVERLQAEVRRYRQLEQLMRDTLMSAEKAAEELRTQSRREYDVSLQEARVQAREIVNDAETRCERLRAEVKRLESLRGEMRASYRAFLQTALERLDADTAAVDVPSQAA